MLFLENYCFFFSFVLSFIDIKFMSLLNEFLNKTSCTQFIILNIYMHP